MDLRSRVIRALGWSAGTRLVAQIATWSMTLVIIRLLEPTDYGLMALATSVIALLNLINELGLGAAIIQRPEITERLLRKVFGLVLVTNASLYAALAFASPYIAGFFEEFRLTLVLQVTGILLAAISFRVIPRSLLQRELDFKLKSVVEMLAVVTGGVLTVILAWHGYGVWALVYGRLCTGFVEATGFQIVRPFLRLPDMDFRGLGELITFGGLMTLSRLVWYVRMHADIWIVGKVLGNEILGVYSVARDVATLPATKLTAIVNQVSLPAFASVQQAPELVARYLRKATALLTLFAIPVFLGISAVSPELVHGVLGPQWEQSVLPIRVISLMTYLLIMMSVFHTVLAAIGKPGVIVGNLTISTFILVTVFVIGSAWGLVGVSMAWVIAYPAMFTVTVLRARPFTGVGFGDLVGAAWTPVLASLLMYAAVWVVRSILTEDFGPLQNLLLLSIIGAAIYGGLTAILNPRGAKEAFDLIRSPGFKKPSPDTL